MIDSPGLHTPVFEKRPILPSRFPRIAPQFWTNLSTAADPISSYVSRVSRRRVGSPHEFLLSASSDSTTHYKYPRITKTQSNNVWTIPNNNSEAQIYDNSSFGIEPTIRTEVSTFAPIIQSEFLRSYRRAVQTYCIISSFLYYQPAVAPITQRSEEHLTDFWVTTSSHEDELAPSFKLQSPSVASPILDKTAEYKADLSEDPSLRVAHTAESRTRASSPERQGNEVLSSGSHERSRSSSGVVTTQSSITTGIKRRFSGRWKTDEGGNVSVPPSLKQLRVARSESELSRLRGLNGFITSTYIPWHYWQNQRKPTWRLNPSALWPNFQGLQPIVSRRTQLLVLQPTRFDVLRAMWIDTATTTIQRHWRGYLGRQKAITQRQWLQWKNLATRGAIKIQRCVRRHLDDIKMEQEEILRGIVQRRQKSAVVIQHQWKKKMRQRRLKLENIVQQIIQMRYEAAKTIQRHYRGYKSRKLVDLEYKRWLVTWKWDPSGKVVELVGSFTTPPWTNRILMSWDSMSRQYVVDLPRLPGRHEMKFIVDGDFCCDGSLTVISDGAGHYNNVVHIAPGVIESPFRRIRGRLRLRNDPVFVPVSTSGFDSRRSASVREISRYTTSFSQGSTKRSTSVDFSQLASTTRFNSNNKAATHSQHLLWHHNSHCSKKNRRKFTEDATYRNLKRSPSGPGPPQSNSPHVKHRHRPHKMLYPQNCNYLGD